MMRDFREEKLDTYRQGIVMQVPTRIEVRVRYESGTQVSLVYCMFNFLSAQS